MPALSALVGLNGVPASVECTENADWPAEVVAGEIYAVFRRVSKLYHSQYAIAAVVFVPTQSLKSITIPNSLRFANLPLVI